MTAGRRCVRAHPARRDPTVRLRGSGPPAGAAEAGGAAGGRGQHLPPQRLYRGRGRCGSAAYFICCRRPSSGAYGGVVWMRECWSTGRKACRAALGMLLYEPPGFLAL